MTRKTRRVDADFDPELGTEDDLGNVTLTGGPGAAFFMPDRFRRALDRNPDRQVIVSELQAATLEITQLRQRMDHLVEHARRSDLSWDLIGWCVGLTGEAARLRWGNR